MKKYYYPAVHLWSIWFEESLFYYLNKNGYKITKNDSVLDIGCGLGYICFKLRKFHPKLISGYDVSESAIEFDKTFNSNINFEEKDITADEFTENSYSVIFSADVYEHVQDPLMMLKNVHKLLTNNGAACITFPNWEHHGRNQFDNINVLRDQLLEAGFKKIKIDIIQDYSLIFKFFMKLYLLLQKFSDKILNVNRIVTDGNDMPESDECGGMYGFQKNQKLKNKKVLLYTINILFDVIKIITRIQPPFKVTKDLSNVDNKRIIFFIIK